MNLGDFQKISKNPKNLKITEIGIYFSGYYIPDIPWISRSGGAQELKDPTTVKKALLYPRDSGFFKSRDFNPPDSGFFLISGFLSPGFGVFYLRDRDFFRGMRYPDKKPTLVKRYTGSSNLLNSTIIYSNKSKVGKVSMKDKLKLTMIHKLTRDECFHFLRTRRALGYSVKCVMVEDPGDVISYMYVKYFILKRFVKCHLNPFLEY